MPGDGRDGAKVADHRNLRPGLLEVCTHTPGRGKTAIDVYTTFEWENFR